MAQITAVVKIDDRQGHSMRRRFALTLQPGAEAPGAAVVSAMFANILAHGMLQAKIQGSNAIDWIVAGIIHAGFFTPQDQDSPSDYVVFMDTDELGYGITGTMSCFDMDNKPYKNYQWFWAIHDDWTTELVQKGGESS